MKKLIKKKKLVIGIALLLVLALVTGTACAKHEDGDDSDSMQTVSVSKMTVEHTITSDGEVGSSLEESLTPHTSYYLEEVKVEAGDSLEEGDTILTYTNGKKMKAPYNCVIITWSLPDEEDQLTSEHYVTIAGTDVLQMELAVDESEVGLVEAGMEATVSIEAAGIESSAVVTSVSDVGDYSDSGATFPVKVTFENEGSIKLGMTGSASIVLEKAEDVLAVPVAAVSTKDGKSYVMQAASGDADSKTGSASGNAGTLVEVETGVSNGSFIEIKSGLREGDTVLVTASSDDSSDSFGFGGGQGGPMPGGEMPDGDHGPDGGHDGSGSSHGSGGSSGGE